LPRALLSVSDKTGLAGFARGLSRLGYELFATSSTLQAIHEAAVDVHPVSDLTGFPEMMDGRIKTLHPGVHAGILARRDKPEHMSALAEHGLREIDLVCCNLYPFVETVSQPQVSFEDAVELPRKTTRRWWWWCGRSGIRRCWVLSTKARWTKGCAGG
jgi:phosphoribosylaminoimidazolecarboxamide formyltransferase/IMP cyclohydrolase